MQPPDLPPVADLPTRERPSEHHHDADPIAAIGYAIASVRTIRESLVESPRGAELMRRCGADFDDIERALHAGALESRRADLLADENAALRRALDTVTGGTT